METTVLVIDTPEKFVAWCKDNDCSVRLRRRGAEILMEYLSMHGKALSANDSGELFINNGILTEKTTFDEVVEQVCDWNYKALIDAKDRKENPVDFLDYCRSCTLEKDLEEHKFILDRIFKQTVYGREIQMTAHKIAREMMKEMHLVPTFDMGNLDSCGMVAEQPFEYGENQTEEEAKPDVDPGRTVSDETAMVRTEEPAEAKSTLVALAMEEIANKEQGRSR